ncbi:MAG: hypothetical protein V1735_01365 [Nanoarchaeota archaeon]
MWKNDCPVFYPVENNPVQFDATQKTEYNFLSRDSDGLLSRMDSYSRYEGRILLDELADSLARNIVRNGTHKYILRYDPPPRVGSRAFRPLNPKKRNHFERMLSKRVKAHSNT